MSKFKEFFAKFNYTVLSYFICLFFVFLTVKMLLLFAFLGLILIWIPIIFAIFTSTVLMAVAVNLLATVIKLISGTAIGVPFRMFSFILQFILLVVLGVGLQALPGNEGKIMDIVNGNVVLQIILFISVIVIILPITYYLSKNEKNTK